MSSSVVQPSPVPRVAPPKERFGHTKAIVALGVVLVLLAVGVALWLRYSPFAQSSVIRNLQEASDSQVTVRSFREVHFPFPGCVLEGLTFRHGKATNPPLITIERLTVRASYLGMLRMHVAKVTAEGMRITVAPFGENEPVHTIPSKNYYDEIVADGAVLKFMPEDPTEKPVQFDIHEATLRDVSWSGPLEYKVAVHNPLPPGEIKAEGKFGVWQEGNAGDTPLSGDYTFDKADLGVYEGIAGTLSSKGKFGGKLKHIDIAGNIDIPDFEVQHAHHEVRVQADFTAYVDGVRGDTYLQRVDARFKKTRVIGSGSVAGIPGRKGKTALLQVSTQHGRIEDMLGLFASDPRAPMSGPASIRAKVEIPTSDEPFLKKVKIDGNFGVDDGTFTKPETQTDVNQLSAGARGDKKDEAVDVVSDLKGHATVVGGTATFSDLSFGIPGAAAKMHGTYSLITHKVDLRGTMQVDSKISDTTTGMKSMVLKLMDPFFKKRKKKGEIVPVHIGGTYDKPTFGLDLGDQNQPGNGQPKKP
jgi:hypothetical protein